MIHSQTKPNEQEVLTFWLCIAFFVLLYSSLFFTIPQHVRFIRCILVRDEIYNSLPPFATIRQPIICTMHLSLLICALYIIYPLVLILEICDVPQIISMHIIVTYNIFVFLSFVSRALVLALNQYFIDTLNNWIWRREINAKQRETNLVIKHERVLNDNRSMVIVLAYLCFTIFVFTLFTTIVHFAYDYHSIIYAIIVITLLLFSLYILNIYIVTNQHELRTELLYTVQSSGIFYGISSILSMFLPHIYSILSQILCLSIAHLIAIYFCCGWSVKKFALRGNAAKGVTESDFMSAFNKKKNPIAFAQIMDHRLGIEAFCAHLAEEYSLDSLLFIIEASQFKAIIHKQIQKSIASAKKNADDDLPTNKSNIFCVNTVLQSNWLPMDPRMRSHAPYKLALHLYDKYIDNDSDLCINISSADRRDIYRTFKELARSLGTESIQKEMESDASVLNVLYTVFDKSLIEIWHLLENDSFYRFRCTHSMYLVLHVLYPKQSQAALKECSAKQKHSKTETKITQYNDTIRSITNTATSAHSVRSQASTLRSMAEAGVDDIQVNMNEEEKNTISEFTRANSARDLASISPLSPGVELYVSSKSAQHSNRNITMEELAELLNAVTVPSEIIKTAADFWNVCINRLSTKERVEVGCAIYLSMLASNRSIHKIFKHNHKIKQEQIEKLAVKFLDMISWLIESLWSRNDMNLNAKLSKLGAIHKNISIEISHFVVMLEAIHEVFQFYFTHYRLQEQYAMDYIFAYSSEIMMGSPLCAGTKSREYYTELEIKHTAEKNKNTSIETALVSQPHDTNYKTNL